MGQRHSTPKNNKIPRNRNFPSPKSLKKKKRAPTKPPNSSPLLSQQSSGLTDPREQNTRETLASWIRDGVAVTDVYDVHEVIGHGHLGEITIVSKKPEHRPESHHSPWSSDSPAVSLRKSFSDEDISRHNNGSSRQRLESYSSVKRSRLYACKTVSTIRLKAGELEELLNEVRIMRDLDHPHILHLYEVYYVKRKLWLIVELCTGGDLYKRINTNTELDVCLVMEQILRAVAYMHRRGVCHRDIKLENILYEHAGPEAGIKLIDFGLAQKYTRNIKMLRACGTFYAVAPEIIDDGGGGCRFSEKSDLFSVGCVAFILLSKGVFPFLKGDPNDVQNEARRERLLQAKYVFGPEWDDGGVSDTARDFIRCCLQKEPDERWSARGALTFVRDQWLPELESADEESDAELNGGQLSERSSHHHEKRRLLDSGQLKCMKDFCMYGQLKKRVLMTMAYTMDKSSIGELSDLFIAMDTEGIGTLSMEDMRRAVRTMYDERAIASPFSEKDLENMFKGIDQDHSGQIHYAEFLAAVIESQGLLTLERLGEAFDRIDSEGKGYISKENLRAMLGSDCNEELVTRMIDEADYRHNGQVDYDEFLSLMFEHPSNPSDVIGMSWDD